MDALIANARFHFHKQLFETNTLTLTTAGVASNADTSSRGSKAIARRIVDILVEEQHHAVSTVDKISGQTLGKQFETLTMEFLRETFPYLQNLRPGNWTILQLGNNNKLKTSDFAQYEHLAYLNALTTQNAQLAAALGNDYLVAPDVVVYRDLYEDSEINAAQPIVDDEICKMADIRKSNGGKPIEFRRQVFVHHLAKLCQVHLLALHGQPHTAKAKVLFYFRKAHNRRSTSILLLFSL